MLKKLTLSLTAAVLPSVALADEAKTYTAPTVGILDPTTTSISTIIEKIISWVLLFAGAIAVLFIIYAGFMYVTSAGNKERIETAKKTLTFAVIGLIVIILANFIVGLVGTTITDVNNQPTTSLLNRLV